LLNKFPLIVDLYDKEKYEGFKNYYWPNNPLSSQNKVELTQ
jgi:hypothetical protein